MFLTRIGFGAKAVVTGDTSQIDLPKGTVSGLVNVLTFGYEAEPAVVAYLVLCAPVVAAEAEAQGVTLEAHYAHLLVHGTLHAQGHDHEDDDDARRMEAHESAVLAELGFADPYRR